MTGSGILDAKYFPKLMSEILNIANSIMRELNINFEYVNMGGGYGIPYKDEDASLDIDEVFSNVIKVFHKFFSGKKIPEFWIEPGRSIVDDHYNSGVYNANWDGKNTSGEMVSSGIYYYSIISNDYVETKSMVYLK